MDGGLHDRIENQKRRDKIKNQLAREHNFKLIRIDCDYKNARYKAFDYIKTHILNSELALLLPLDKINWEQCKKIAKNSIMVQICDMWENQHCNCKTIADTLQLHRTTVCTYLKRGFDIGLCPSYSTEESLNRRDNKKRIALIKEGVIISVFSDGNQCATDLTRKMGIIFKPKQIRSCANGYLSHYHGLNFKYITREEHEQYKMIENNGVVKEGMICSA